MRVGESGSQPVCVMPQLGWYEVCGCTVCNSLLTTSPGPGSASLVCRLCMGGLVETRGDSRDWGRLLLHGGDSRDSGRPVETLETGRDIETGGDQW